VLLSLDSPAIPLRRIYAPQLRPASFSLLMLQACPPKLHAKVGSVALRPTLSSSLPFASLLKKKIVAYLPKF
jgi:hypothetical protein